VALAAVSWTAYLPSVERNNGSLLNVGDSRIGISKFHFVHFSRRARVTCFAFLFWSESVYTSGSFSLLPLVDFVRLADADIAGARSGVFVIEK
jgi:hypothetical protein